MTTTLTPPSNERGEPWDELPRIVPAALTEDDLFRPCYLLADLQVAGDDDAGGGLTLLPCTLVNFTGRTLTVRLSPTTRELYGIAHEHVICAPRFVRRASAEETAHALTSKKELYDDGY